MYVFTRRRPSEKPNPWHPRDERSVDCLDRLDDRSMAEADSVLDCGIGRDSESSCRSMKIPDSTPRSRSRENQNPVVIIVPAKTNKSVRLTFPRKNGKTVRLVTDNEPKMVVDEIGSIEAAINLMYAIDAKKEKERLKMKESLKSFAESMSMLKVEVKYEKKKRDEQSQKRTVKKTFRKQRGKRR